MVAMSSARRLAWPLAVVVAILAAVSPGLGAGHTLAWRDTLHEFVPLRPLIAAALRSGRLPLWDPWDGTGTPLFAQMYHAVLHPPAALLSLIAPRSSIDLLLVTYLLLAGLGTYAAARTFGAEPPGAALAGIGFGCSGFVLSSLGLFPFLASSASFPWMVAAARRAGKGARFAASGVALAVAATFLAGDVFAVTVGVCLGAAVALDAGRWRALFRFVAGCAVGTLLAGVQLLPAWALEERSSRALELSAAIRAQWALSPWRLIEMVAPGFFAGRTGAIGAPVFQALEPRTLLPDTFCASVFVGVALLVAALAGARARSVRHLAFAIPLLLWVAVGRRLGAEQLLHYLPVWGRLRYTEKLVGALTFCVALLAAFGVDRFAEVVRPRRVLWALGASALALATIWARPTSDALLGPLLGPAAAVGRAQLGEGLLHTVAALVAILACLQLHRRAPAWLPPALVAVVALEALSASPFAVHATPLPLSPPLQVAAPPPGARICTPSLGRFTLGLRTELDRQADLMMALGYVDMNAAAPVDNVWIYSALPSRRYDYLYEEFQDECRPYRRYATTHVVLPAGVAGEKIAAAVAGGERVRADGRIEVWSVPHRAWASFAPEARVISKPRETLTATIANLRSERPEVVVEGAQPLPTAPGTVLSVSRASERVEVEAEATGLALLVVNDAYWPGWEARIDGSPVPIFPADVLVRAVPFPPGRHRLVMNYAPPEVSLGLALSAVGLGLFFGLAALEWRLRPRPGGPDGPSPGTASEGLS